LAVDKLQGDEGPSGSLADFVNLDDVGVLQPRHGLGFSVKAPALFAGTVGPKHLQGHDAVETLMPGFEDDAHAAASHFFEQFIVGKSAFGQWCGRGQSLFDKLVCLAEPFQEGGVLGILPEMLLPVRQLAQFLPQRELMVDELGSARRLVRQLGMVRQHFVCGDALAGDPVAALLGQDGIEETFEQAIGLVRSE
jgi:hypothetical protein